ncbi:hypothetical protein LZ31DRAFT_603854 [Colletotrichum somersetense]|nr:hypothetical protein LZ31DRAFT_603854 [Colletotrichum somersetense]
MHTQYLALGLLCRAVLLTAAPLKPRTSFEKRDNLATIETALSPVFGALSAVDSAVVSLDGTALAAQRLYDASQGVQATVDEATITVRATGPLSVSHSLKLRKSTDTLASQTKTTLDDLVSHKSILDTLGFSSTVLLSLEQQEAATMALSEALAEKVPMIGQPEAASDKSNMEAMFTKAIAAYSVPETPDVVVPVAPVPVAPVPVAPVPVAPVPVTPVVPPVVPVTPTVPVPAPIIIASTEAEDDMDGVDVPVEDEE